MALPCKRDHFDVPTDVVYLNCAYMGPLSRQVREAGVEALSRKAQPWKIVPSDFFTDVERARELFAEIVGADPEGVALLPSVSYGIATAARNLPITEGSEIVVLFIAHEAIVEDQEGQCSVGTVTAQEVR